MPHVTIRIFENEYTKEQKSKAAKAITAAINTSLNEDPAHIEIHFIELKAENVAKAGVTAAEWAESQKAAAAAKPAAKATTKAPAKKK